MMKALGKIFGQFKRGAQRFNAESRAFREMEKQKTRPVAAPRHPSNLKKIEELQQETAEFSKKHNVLDKGLDERLQQVFVTSTDPEPIVYKIHRAKDGKPLPHNRGSEIFELGYKETDTLNIPIGRITFRQTLDLLANHRSDPETHTAEALAIKYKLNLDVTRNILQHFKSFEMHVPNSKDKIKLLKASEDFGGLITPESGFSDLKALVGEVSAKKIADAQAEKLKEIDAANQNDGTNQNDGANSKNVGKTP